MTCRITAAEILLWWQFKPFPWIVMKRYEKRRNDKIGCFAELPILIKLLVEPRSSEYLCLSIISPFQAITWVNLMIVLLKQHNSRIGELLIILSFRYSSNNWQCLRINTSQISFLVKTSFILVLESSVLIYWNYLSICECKRTLFLVDCLWKTNKSTFILIIGTLYLKIQMGGGGGCLSFIRKLFLRGYLGL